MSSAAPRRVSMLCTALLLASSAMAASGAGESRADPAALEAAFASAERPATDREQDARRHSREVLEFLGVKPGMHVIDVFSAGGYNTELLARAVGVKGQVVAYNNPAYARYAAKAIDERYRDARLGNVRQVTAEVDELDLAPNSLDAALFVMSYHDVYFRPKDGGFDRMNGEELLARIRKALKPGGVVVVQDHVANAGGDPKEVADELHRIDPAVVRRDFERAGFEFDGSSDVLKHPEDDHGKLVFDEAIRGRTDQFVYRFRKPVS
ncbi:MAG TPA: methyltransferase domain-containing protein [Steroidobacteraceae bacterium]|nr:methyltransferase domain-containing protein [Steroidobacteraceae bacterium]